MKAVHALVLALSGAVVAVAAPAPEISFDPTAHALPAQPERVAGVEVLQGGASEEEMAYLQAQASRYALQVLFSGRGGAYGVAQKLTVRDGAREVVSVSDAGPLVMLKLPPGTYAVEADFGGAVERRAVTIGSGATRVNWNSPQAAN